MHSQPLSRALGSGKLSNRKCHSFSGSLNPEHDEALRSLMDGSEVPFDVMGSVGGDRIRIGGMIEVTVADARTAHDGALLAGHD